MYVHFQGDSGGPFVCKNERRIWTLIGISTSSLTERTGLSCAQSFFTKVDRYLDFINKGDLNLNVFIYNEYTLFSFNYFIIDKLSQFFSTVGLIYMNQIFISVSTRVGNRI